MELSQLLDFVDGGEKVNEAATLAPSSHALFAKEFRDLLVSLEVGSPIGGAMWVLGCTDVHPLICQTP
jgi:hypothetical protein